MKFQSKIANSLLSVALLAISTTSVTSCSWVDDDLEPCTAEIRFVYDYNMEFANAFHKQVDCLDVYIYDSEGTLVSKERITDESLLTDENYRMKVDLPDGDYRVVAYGGMGCDRTSFRHINEPELGSAIEELHVQLDGAALNGGDKARLHNHYSGSVSFTMTHSNRVVATVEMMRNTNNIQIGLSYTDGRAIDVNDFTYEITDDNNDMFYNPNVSSSQPNFANSLLATGEITYKPYNTVNVDTGVSDDATSDDPTWHNAVAQFSTSRLVTGKTTPTYLSVKWVESGNEIFRIPLVNYMIMYKNGYYTNLSNMSNQEFLDRENTWNFMFFLGDDNLWVSSRIIVNDWEVRINDIEQ